MTEREGDKMYLTHCFRQTTVGLPEAGEQVKEEEVDTVPELWEHRNHTTYFCKLLYRAFLLKLCKGFMSEAAGLVDFPSAVHVSIHPKIMMGIVW